VPDPITQSTANGESVTRALAFLAASYFDRLVAGDWARASVVLNAFSQAYNVHHEAFVAYAVRPGADASWLPARIDAFYTLSTRRALAAALVVGFGISSAIGEAMPVTVEVGSVRPWFERVRPAITTPADAFMDAIEHDSMGTLGTNIISRVNGILMRSTAEVIRDERTTPFDTPPAGPVTNTDASRGPIVQGPSILVHPTRFVMPTWGWWAVGLGLVAASGVVIYGVVERGWFGGKR